VAARASPAPASSGDERVDVGALSAGFLIGLREGVEAALILAIVLVLLLLGRI